MTPESAVSHTTLLLCSHIPLESIRPPPPSLRYVWSDFPRTGVSSLLYIGFTHLTLDKSTLKAKKSLAFVVEQVFPLPFFFFLCVNLWKWSPAVRAVDHVLEQRCGAFLLCFLFFFLKAEGTTLAPLRPSCGAKTHFTPRFRAVSWTFLRTLPGLTTTAKKKKRTQLSAAVS